MMLVKGRYQCYSRAVPDVPNQTGFRVMMVELSLIGVETPKFSDWWVEVWPICNVMYLCMYTVTGSGTLGRTFHYN